MILIFQCLLIMYILLLLDYRYSESVLRICVRIIQYYGMFLNVNFANTIL